MSGALLAMLLAALDSSIVNTALPRMVTDLGGLTHLSWVVTAFMLSSTITTPIYGKLSDSFGRRNMFGAAIVIFVAGSALCGAAQTMDELIAFRTVQGLGAGGLLVLAQATIGDVVAPRDRPRYQGLFTGTFGLASIAGPLLGGIITQLLSWRWIFYVNLPVGALAFVMVWLGMKRIQPGRPPGNAQRIDYLGTLLLTGLTTALLLMLAWGGTQFAWTSGSAFGLDGLILFFFITFLWRESRASEPLIRLALFRNPVFARGSAVGGMVMFAMVGSLVYMPLYFQLVLGMSPAESGAMTLPQVGGMLFSSILGGRIVTRYGHYRPFLLAGIGLEALSLAGLALLAILGAPPALFLIVMATLGLGIGMGMPNLTNAVQNAVAHAELGAATGAMIFIRSLGGSVGVAASGAIMAARLAGAHQGADVQALTSHGIRALDGLSSAQQYAVANDYRSALTGSFLLCSCVMVVAFVLVVGLPEIQLRKQIDGGGDTA
jgi:EmrB/QacA subfamily drug resistance transporter